MTFTPSGKLVATLLAIYSLLNIVSLTLVEHSAGVTTIASWNAILSTSLVLFLLPFFGVAEFSFGFLVSAMFLGTISGFIWLSFSTKSQYDHELARWSAIASLFAFSLPLLFHNGPATSWPKIEIKYFRRILHALVLVSVGLLMLNERYGLQFALPSEAAALRADISRPITLNYFTNNFVYAVLPFCFAFFWHFGSKFSAIVTLVIMGLYYPVLLTKTVLFALVWLPFILILFRRLDEKIATVACFSIPLLFGLICYVASAQQNGSVAQEIFGYANERMFALPSIALDYYADFFANHANTFFCQIKIVQWFTDCPYLEQLGVVFAKQYGVGNLNASLFATEGIASVGLKWAPATAFLCGFILSFGNRASRHLPPSFVATSGSLLLIALRDVPLSTTLLTNGGFVLFFLWSVSPNLECNIRAADVDTIMTPRTHYQARERPFLTRRVS